MLAVYQHFFFSSFLLFFFFSILGHFWQLSTRLPISLVSAMSVVSFQPIFSTIHPANICQWCREFPLPPPSSLLSDIETNLATVANSAMHWALSRKKKVKMKEFGPWNGVQYRSNRTSNQTARAEEERSGGVVMTPETRVELAMLLI